MGKNKTSTTTSMATSMATATNIGNIWIFSNEFINYL